VLAGVTVLAVLALHGALWVALKTAAKSKRARAESASRVWWGVLVLMNLLTVASFRVQPRLQASFVARPWGWVFPFVANRGLLTVAVMNYRLRERAAFLASSLFLAAMLVSVAFGLYPCVLPSKWRSRALADHRQCLGRALWPARRPGLVHPRHAADRRVFRLRLPQLRRQGGRRRAAIGAPEVPIRTSSIR